MVLIQDLGVPMILSAKTLARIPVVIDLAWAVVFLGPYRQRVPLVTTTEEASDPDMNESTMDCHTILWAEGPRDLKDPQRQPGCTTRACRKVPQAAT